MCLLVEVVVSGCCAFTCSYVITRYRLYGLRSSQLDHSAEAVAAFGSQRCLFIVVMIHKNSNTTSMPTLPLHSATFTSAMDSKEEAEGRGGAVFLEQFMHDARIVLCLKKPSLSTNRVFQGFLVLPPFQLSQRLHATDLGLTSTQA